MTVPKFFGKLVADADGPEFAGVGVFDVAGVVGVADEDAR